MKKPIYRTPKEVYELWIAALRSGKYKQGQDVLKHKVGNVTKYCCLGVLCDLASKDGGPKWRTDSSQSFDGYVTTIPKEMRKYLNMTRPQLSQLMYMNDVQGMKFPQIADYIETKLMPRVL